MRYLLNGMNENGETKSFVLDGNILVRVDVANQEQGDAINFFQGYDNYEEIAESPLGLVSFHNFLKENHLTDCKLFTLPDEDNRNMIYSFNEALFVDVSINMLQAGEEFQQLNGAFTYLLTIHYR